MIKSVTIKNFQSYKEETIKFKDGLNIIAGTSGSGKSTIRRALLWVITNKPNGTSIISWWAKKNGKITDEVKVTIELDNGTVISRVRSSKENNYIINDKVLEAVGTDVPQEVKDAFNIGDINYSAQMDSPFLVSQSAGYVATYLNDIVDLGDADYYQSSIESKRRETVKDIQNGKVQVEQINKKLAEYDSIELISKVLDRCEKLELDFSTQETSFFEMKRTLEEYESFEDYTPTITKASTILSSIDISALVALQEKIRNLETLVEQREGLYKASVDENDIIYAERLLMRSTRLYEALVADYRTYNAVDMIVRDYNRWMSEDVHDEITEIQEVLAQVKHCPLCGGKI